MSTAIIPGTSRMRELGLVHGDIPRPWMAVCKNGYRCPPIVEIGARVMVETGEHGTVRNWSGSSKLRIELDSGSTVVTQDFWGPLVCPVKPR